MELNISNLYCNIEHRLCGLLGPCRDCTMESVVIQPDPGVSRIKTSRNQPQFLEPFEQSCWYPRVRAEEI